MKLGFNSILLAFSARYLERSRLLESTMPNLCFFPMLAAYCLKIVSPYFCFLSLTLMTSTCPELHMWLVILESWVLNLFSPAPHVVLFSGKGFYWIEAV